MFLYPLHQARAIDKEPSDCGKSVFLTNSISNKFNDLGKMQVYLSTLHQGFYEKLIKGFSSFLSKD